jgi:hypothetical protein
VEPGELRRFTGYHPAFIASVAWNMRNNRLWTARGIRYLALAKPRGVVDEHLFLEDFDIAPGTVWCWDAEFLHHAIDAWDVYKQLEPLATVPYDR